MNFSKINELDYKKHIIFLLPKNHNLRDIGLAEKEISYAKEKFQSDSLNLFFNHFDKKIFISAIDTSSDLSKQLSQTRKNAYQICKLINSEKIDSIQFSALNLNPQIQYAFLEALALSNYQFTKYLTKDLDKKLNTLNQIDVFSNDLSDSLILKLNIISQAVSFARDLGNEPYPQLNSENLPEKILQLTQQTPINVETLNKTKIQSLNMGGLLAVNSGSKFEPTFSILTYKPENHKNQKPIILVGKGIVFDSGGLNLKPTGYIEDMKSDMSGAAAVISTIYAAAKLNLPLYIIGLIPATDNAISEKSYAPGQIIKISNGLTVEIRNTDAEGRLILADALSFAQKYDPYLVIDLATLTGSAVCSLGNLAAALFSTADNSTTEKILNAANLTDERLVQFPLWDEYNEMLKSDIADLKNIGGKNAGAITAAKFLENFTNYPWIHLDIAPTAFINDNKDYRGNGATGFGVRLLINFFEQLF